MPGAEMAIGAILAAAIGTVLVARRRARGAGRAISIPTAIATGVVLGLVTAELFGWAVVVAVHGLLDRLAR